ncbi:inositol-3-phosphate synthase [Streptomyces acidiscabies]|uniref:Inositol-3-phosphate synthase n=4 Tax=Streptomyces acidiscabies TaxID=42234 RepID=A0AAP6EGG3_9ACTN|nr:inositol-3-phosphate synthase [Streptomyces acidiscabies]MBP5935825.1 myo-inositol-1-phosphate synthase [Streptomyces sp. LBUM 1476]MBZ3916268.1 inositol-3-phosphate synthase [Streptomyces acidiscabies]MDX2962057.1 inositol-3-phosphate synthase [Streptomyces acidiscabies]MDX3017946.1 inositol-3-phosphate synthase [Streptomyces acidiscabies]MDX3791281.1 inositol-3-phosphate synthase [Streptomyces acidiscabies]
MPDVGVWLIGARGSVATTAVAGCAAVTAGLRPSTGLVTEKPEFANSGLPPLTSLVFGGHDISDTPLVKRAEELAAEGVLPVGLAAAVERELAAADREIRVGWGRGGAGGVRVVADGGPGDVGAGREGGGGADAVSVGVGARVDAGGSGEVWRSAGLGDAVVGSEGPFGLLERDEQYVAALAADIQDFMRRRGLARAVVVNVASTEAAVNGAALPPSSLYAAAALRAGCPYVNFTPSTGLHHPALAGFAEARGLPYAGRDGKTGQTLLRSVLGPMFNRRALDVRSWSGVNLLGGGDGAALADPGAAAAKNAGKERVLADTLGTTPEGRVHIDDVPALGDWKTAWDHIAFDGFLGTRMTLQTTWQGCDSALAAPLVLDLARLTLRAHELGLSGALPALAFFFKDPVGEAASGLEEQWGELVRFARELGVGEVGRRVAGRGFMAGGEGA